MSFSNPMGNKSQNPAVVDINNFASPVAQGLNDPHPLESRVANWKANEEEFNLRMLQKTQGLAAPLRRVMDAKIVEQSTFVPSIVGGPSNLSLDILKNEDARLDWEDVYKTESTIDFHQEMQKRMGL